MPLYIDALNEPVYDTWWLNSGLLATGIYGQSGYFYGILGTLPLFRYLSMVTVFQWGAMVAPFLSRRPAPEGVEWLFPQTRRGVE